MACAVRGFLIEHRGEDRVWTPECKRTQKPAGNLLLCPLRWVVMKVFIGVWDLAGDTQ